MNKFPMGFRCQHTTNLDWSLQLKQNGLIDENFSCFCTQIFDFVFCELHRFSRAVATHCKEATKMISKVSNAS